MGEVSGKVSRLSDTEIIREYRRALVVLYPTLQKLDCLEDDAEPYDDFDEVAATLWHDLVEKSLMWKHGLDAPPRLPPYGFARWDGPTDGFVEVLAEQPPGRYHFVQFIGNRRFGDEPFNAVDLLDGQNAVVTVAYRSCREFNWVRV